ncbi:RICIN domain-containing protein [Agathobacter rectalis]|nr:RICIN domain-containing protein [Agathobacter rectalis]
MPPNIVLAANNADDIVSIARGELGSTNYSKYYGGNKGAWCADFVSWCAQQAGVDSIAKSSSCYNMYIGMKNNGCQEVSSPQKGDIVFFYCTKCSSTAGKWCHVGIMEDSTYSIEGNRWSNGVSKVERGNSYSHNGDLGYKHRDGIVRKYLRPKYSFPNPVTTTPSIWKNSDSYTVGNSATLTWNSVDNATGYWFSVWYKGEQIVTTQVSGSSEYTLNNLGEGEYTAYITAYNDSSSKQGYVTFRVNYLDIGTNFIANIIKVDSWSHVVNDNTNACIGKEVGNANEYYEFVRQSDGSYIIKSLEDGKYLEVSDGGNKNGQNVGFSDYTGENNQRWYIKNGSSGKILIPKNATGSCLDISNNGSAVGTNAQIWAQAGVAAQEFSIYTQSNIPNFINFGDDFYANIIKASTWSTLVNKNPNLEVGGEGEAEGSDIWHFRRMKDGTYIIQSLFDGKYLDVEKFSNQKGANVYCYDYTGDSNQRWYLTLGKNGKVLIPKNATGLCLDVSNDGSDAGTNAQLWEPNGTTAQEFNVYKEDTIKLGTANVTLSNNNYIYDGKEKKPDVTVKYGYATLQQGTDYTVEYSNNVKAGTATVTIKGTGIYSGTVSKNFEIKEALYTVYGYQVVINGNFDLKYYIDLSKEAANDTDAYIEFKVGDKVQKVKQRETSNGHYVYTCEVPVAQIGDKVTATLHYKDKSYALTQYSVKDYLNTIVQNKDKKEEYGKAADIASAILNYGARAQLYFGYKTDSLVYSALPDAEIKKVDSILAQDIKKAITNKESGNLENNDFKYYGASLVCKSDTGMKLYFENKNSLSLKEIEKKYDISVKDCKKQVSKSINGNMICITINDLNATELDDNFVVQITNKQNSSQSMSVSTSPYIYIKKSMDSGNTKLINLSKAMYWYSQKAMEYSMTENR